MNPNNNQTHQVLQQENKQNPNPYYPASEEPNVYPVNSKQDPEALNENFMNEDFQNSVEKSMRLGFISKVYGVLFCQLFLTALIASTGFMKGYQDWAFRNMWFFYVSIACSILVLIPLVCVPKLARKVPTNYILLFTFTAFEAIMLSYMIASVNDPETVLIAAGLTLGITLSLTLYAMNTKTDFTVLVGIMISLCILLLLFGILSLIFGGVLRLLYLTLGVFFYSIVLIIDTQLIMDEYGRSYSIDDYVFAALNIYIDIIRIFVYILSILGSGRR